MIYWITGQPGAGKTTLAGALNIALLQRCQRSLCLDSDTWRAFRFDQDYSEAGRRKNVAAAQEFAERLVKEGLTVICSFVSPYLDQREALKSRTDVVEIYVHTDKIRGREHYHVKDYEPPVANYIDIDTGRVSPKEAVEIVLNLRPVSSLGRARA